MFLDSRGGKASAPKHHNSDKRLCSSRDIVEVYLLVNENPKRMRATKQNYIARIAVISQRGLFVKVNIHVWNVSDNKATIKPSKPRKSAKFEKRKTNYAKIGETKYGKCTLKSDLEDTHAHLRGRELRLLAGVNLIVSTLDKCRNC